MRALSDSITAMDLFCGAGGSTTGAVAAGVTVRMAANHWALAVETHNTNHPDTDHVCADVSQSEPRRYPSTTILLASPECTTLSQSGGRRHEPNLFNPDGDPRVERSRATMWDVPRFAEVHAYRCVIVENVVEVRRWAPYQAWLEAMHLLGYEHREVFLNSMVAHPTPQSRDRIYVVFWRSDQRAPELDFRAHAWCPTCEKAVEAWQAWKRPERPGGKYKAQYLYRCPGCRGITFPYAFPAASAIDWSLPAPRIGDRVKPLAEATRRRIRIGLERFGVALVQHGGHTYEAGDYARAWSVMAPVPAQTATLDKALACPPFMLSHYDVTVPLIAELRGGSSTASPVTAPAATVTASGNHHALVVPYHAKGAAQSDVLPLPTQDTTDRFALVVKNYGDGRDASMTHPPTDPLGTVTARDHHSAIEMDRISIEVDDCGFRMLEPHEIQAAMAFPAEYRVLGTKRDKVRQLGNAVTPPVMALLVRRCVESLDG